MFLRKDYFFITFITFEQFHFDTFLLIDDVAVLLVADSSDFSEPADLTDVESLEELLCLLR
jgi:hypothetical protein